MTWLIHLSEWNRMFVKESLHQSNNHFPIHNVFMTSTSADTEMTFHENLTVESLKPFINTSLR